MTTVYYAHPFILNNSIQEKEDIEFIKSFGFNVINPNDKIHEDEYKKFGMEYFYKIIRDADHVFFRTFPDGKIPDEIYKEIAYAKRIGKQILEIPGMIETRRLSEEETKNYYKLIGRR